MSSAGGFGPSLAKKSGICAVNVAIDQSRHRVTPLSGEEPPLYPYNNAVGAHDLRDGAIVFYENKESVHGLGSRLKVSSTCAGLGDGSGKDRTSVEKQKMLLKMSLTPVGVIISPNNATQGDVADMGAVAAVSGVVSIPRDTAPGEPKVYQPGTIVYAELPHHIATDQYTHSGKPSVKYGLVLTTRPPWDDIKHGILTKILSAPDATPPRGDMDTINAAIANIVYGIHQLGKMTTATNPEEQARTLFKEDHANLSHFNRMMSGFLTCVDYERKWRIGMVVKDRGHAVDVLLSSR